MSKCFCRSISDTICESQFCCYINLHFPAMLHLDSHSPENDPITKLCCRLTSKCYYTHGFYCMYINVFYAVSTRNSAHFDTRHVVSECLKCLLLVQQIIDTPRFSHVASLKMKFALSWKHTNS